MLFDKNGLYMFDDNQGYDFAIDFINGMPASGNNENYNFKKPNNNLKLYNLEDALKYGNAFPNLYDAYKNYKPSALKASNARERALLEIQMLEFSLTDLNLYLDLNPTDVYAYQVFKDYAKECKNKKEVYTRTYGPLTITDITDDYEWSRGVWPWEEGAM